MLIKNKKIKIKIINNHLKNINKLKIDIFTKLQYMKNYLKSLETFFGFEFMIELYRNN